MVEQLAFDFKESQPPSIKLKDFHRNWFGDCRWCEATDVPIFCTVGTDAVCSDCFTKEVEKRQ